MPDTKPTNPKDALGIKKVPLHCIPTAPLLEVGLAMMEGGRKYGTHNYRAIGVRMSTYYDAVWRHLTAWWEGEDIDPDSGLHHLIKAAACCFVVRDSMIMGNCEDDRPLKYTDGLDMNELNSRAASLIEKYPECAEPFLNKGTIEPLPPTSITTTSCGRCSGTGKLPGCAFKDGCPNCKGTGRIAACAACGGMGHSKGYTCCACDGTGKGKPI
jgi:hypothetical protein